MTENSVLYVTGPVTGYPDGNKAMFEAATKWLRERVQVKRVISPLEEDTPEQFAATMSFAYGDVYWQRIAYDLMLIAGTITGIVLLPGWQKSTGSQLEVITGLRTGKEFFAWDFDQGAVAFQRMQPESVRALLVKGLS